MQNFSIDSNFDFYIKLKSGIEIFFGIKYTEDKFSSVKNEEPYDKEYEIYSKIMENNDSIASEYKEIDKFYPIPSPA